MRKIKSYNEVIQNIMKISLRMWKKNWNASMKKYKMVSVFT